MEKGVSLKFGTKHIGIRKGKKPFDLGDFSKTVQERRVAELKRVLGHTPRDRNRNSDHGGLLLAHGISETKNLKSEKTREEIKDDEDLKSKLTSLTMKTLEKKRGYFYNNVEYGFKSKSQKEKEEFFAQMEEKARALTVNLSEEVFYFPLDNRLMLPDEGIF